ncbi:hypothetical protein ACFQZO_30975 [Bradyrhizobium sp. GCM10027634]|uniref:hypothetical protein n=1 Tax=unclassified Bradyrhizobium TaxID=2631580 RepID=UPI00263A3E51|nr:hypothetical protein [Bradyrhizobium sp. WYCCWR 12677]MDN5005285.1 hypothetical protein [Bradyrhizobium sp. WYCCWR 12677]
MMSGEWTFEYATVADPALNYCLWDYSPAAPIEDKFRSINLLFQSFEHAGLGARAFELVEAIRDAIGPFRTVFGIKFLNGRLAWEFYFYDYARRQREVSISRVLSAVRPLLPCDVPIDERPPYFMFSIDFDAELASGARTLDVVHMYIGNPGSTVSSGIAYAVGVSGTKLENFYFFFDGRNQLDSAADKICSSAHFDETRRSVEAVLLPELRECRTICVANKQTHDCVYFSGVDVNQLLWFMERFGYPDPITEFVARNRTSLDHLLFDVGFDYRMEGEAITVLKSGYYGVF